MESSDGCDEQDKEIIRRRANLMRSTTQKKTQIDHIKEQDAKERSKSAGSIQNEPITSP